MTNPATPANTETMRLFVAFEVGAELGVWHRRLGQALDPGLARLTPLANWHLTIKFIGNVSATEARAIDSRLAAIRSTTFELHIDCAGAFPRLTAAHSLWIGPREQPASLLELQQQVAALCSENDSQQIYRPHITVGRANVKSKMAGTKFRTAWGQIVASHGPALIKPTSFTLVRSHLERPHVRYEPLAHYALGNR